MTNTEKSMKIYKTFEEVMSENFPKLMKNNKPRFKKHFILQTG